MIIIANLILLLRLHPIDLKELKLQ